MKMAAMSGLGAMGDVYETQEFFKEYLDNLAKRVYGLEQMKHRVDDMWKDVQTLKYDLNAFLKHGGRRRLQCMRCGDVSHVHGKDGLCDICSSILQETELILSKDTDDE
jgi:hypothetical protein